MTCETKVKLDVERFKKQIIEVVDRAITFDVSPYEDVIDFSPPLLDSRGDKWTLYWRAALDTIDIHYQQQGIIVNIQTCTKRCDCVYDLNVSAGHWKSVDPCILGLGISRSAYRIFWKHL